MDLLIIAIILSFILTLVCGSIVIPMLRKFKFGQNVRDDGPKSHLKKAGTPTMGGIIFLIPLILITFVMAKGNSEFVFAALLVTVGFGLIGFLDDYIKIAKKRSLGLRAYQKLLGQISIAVGFSYYVYQHPELGSSVYIPFLSGQWDLGFFYIPFMAFIIVGTTNSVNLTDGLDGLAAGVTSIVAATFSIIISFAVSLYHGQDYLVQNLTNLSIFAGALTGVCMGFLRFNGYPAQVFMGDTGSLGLGGAIVAIAILLKLPLFLPLFGGVYMAETFSVILQVISFKTRGKRIFKMSPLHHHFELTGMPETKVVSMFMISTVVLCLIGLLAI